MRLGRGIGLYTGRGQGNLPANNGAFSEQRVIGKQLETIFACMLKNDAHQVYGDCNYLPDVFEIHGLGLLENDLVLVVEVNKAYFNFRAAMAIGHLAKEYKLVVADGVSGGVNGLNNVYDARHP